jgi:hypothetical protein
MAQQHVHKPGEQTRGKTKKLNEINDPNAVGKGEASGSIPLVGTSHPLKYKQFLRKALKTSSR